MQSKLDPQTAHILKIRVFISRSSHLFTLQQLADGFDINITTLHRYDNEPYRELSRVYARRAKKRDRLTCATCQAPLKRHQRCEECTILLHDTSEKRCLICIDESKMVYHSQILCQ